MRIRLKLGACDISHPEDYTNADHPLIFCIGLAEFAFYFNSTLYYHYESAYSRNL
jgi:hypothetical protein